MAWVKRKRCSATRKIAALYSSPRCYKLLLVTQATIKLWTMNCGPRVRMNHTQTCSVTFTYKTMAHTESPKFNNLYFPLSLIQCTELFHSKSINFVNKKNGEEIIEITRKKTNAFLMVSFSYTANPCSISYKKKVWRIDKKKKVPFRRMLSFCEITQIRGL